MFKCLVRVKNLRDPAYEDTAFRVNVACQVQNRYRLLLRVDNPVLLDARLRILNPLRQQVPLAVFKACNDDLDSQVGPPQYFSWRRLLLRSRRKTMSGSRYF